MIQTRDTLINQLISIIQQLPIQMLRQLSESANNLFNQYLGRNIEVTEQEKPKRGSPEAMLQALEEVGPLEFDPGELERLMEENKQEKFMMIYEDYERYELPA
ncbi:MAG: hypothetical protein AAF639_18785 [Chloroflexota bacterium]